MMVEALQQPPQPQPQPQHAPMTAHNPEPQAVAGMPRLFVGQVPTDKGEADLFPLFAPYGTVEKITMVRGPEGKSRGCAMVQFKRWSEAEKAMDALNGTSPLEGGKGRPLVVHFANPRRTVGNQQAEPAIAPRKLFVGQIPKTAGEPDLLAVFSPFGEVESVNILKSKGLHAGCAFVQYRQWASCEAAIEALHEQMVMPGCEHALVVKFADAKRRDDPSKRGQDMFDAKKQMMAMGMGMGMVSMNGLMGGHPMLGGMLAGDMGPMGLQAMSMAMPGMAAMLGGSRSPRGLSHSGGHVLLGLHNGKVDGLNQLASGSRDSLLEGMDRGLNGGLGLPDGLHGHANGLGGLSTSSTMSSSSAAIVGLPGMNGHHMVGGLGGDNPMALLGGTGGGMAMPHHLLMEGAAQRGKVGRGVSDPAAYAHKLFVGQIPFEASEQDLWALFAPVGDILELAILRSQGRSKGCAFLTFATRAQALTAINAFNGRPAGPNKKLVVKFADQK